VITLACDLNIFAASISANLTAILLTVLNLAFARDMCTFVVFLVGRHGITYDHGLSDIVSVKARRVPEASTIPCRFAGFLSRQMMQG